MDDQKSLTSGSQLPTKWQPRYIIKRIGEDSIEIDKPTRDAILSQLGAGGKFVQIGEHTLMLNGMKGIDPKWGDKNIPPRPMPKFVYDGLKIDYWMDGCETLNQEEVDEWDKYFG